jgi:hypothetical protein
MRPLRPGLLWLTLNLALIIHRLSQNNMCFQCYIPRKMFLRTRWVLAPQVEDHCPRERAAFLYLGSGAY